MVDTRRYTIILPINGFAVPFHINTLKSAIKQEEGEFTVLRLQFVTPGAITGKKEDTVRPAVERERRADLFQPFEDPNATFVRGLTYRSTDSFRYAEIHKEINDLKKAATKRDNERKELADVVEQDKLTEIKGASLVLRPMRTLTPSRQATRQAHGRASATLVRREAPVGRCRDPRERYPLPVVDEGGPEDRYVAAARCAPLTRADLLFSNIKHLLFQPCDNELIVVLHIHLKNPILVGKKKAKDIQFFREASDASFDETGNKKRRRNYADEDELESEQEERKRRAELNKYFKAFADKIAEAVRTCSPRDRS